MIVEFEYHVRLLLSFGNSICGNLWQILLTLFSCNLNTTLLSNLFLQVEEEESEEEVDSDDVIEDEFVKTSAPAKKKGGKFGPLGTKGATIKWFKSTQSHQLREKTGVFAIWFHGIITRR